MTTKSAFETAMGGALLPLGQPVTFARTSGNILTASGHGLQTGAGPFKCQTTSGADLPSGLTAAVRASTFVTAVSVIATDALVIGETTYTFIATPASAYDVDVGGSDAASMENLARAINGGPGAGTDFDIDTPPHPDVTAEARGDTCVVTAKSLDATIGNAIAATTEDSTLTWDNALLEGGASGTDYYVIALDADTFSLATSVANAEAGTAVALADAGTGIHTLCPTVSSLSTMMEELARRMTHPSTRTLPAEFATQTFWQSFIDYFTN